MADIMLIDAGEYACIAYDWDFYCLYFTKNGDILINYPN